MRGFPRAMEDRGNPLVQLSNEKKISGSVAVEEKILDANCSFACDLSDLQCFDASDFVRGSKGFPSAPIGVSYHMDRMGSWVSLSSLPQASHTTQSHTNPHEHHTRWPPPQP